jgi:NAD(P)H-dependent FMN reductase
MSSLSTAEIPHFNPDLDGEATPSAVTLLREQVGGADAVLIATPEYAHSLPGSLKNALDWLVGSGELYRKPVVVLAGSPREDGARQGREALAQTLRAQGAEIVQSRTVPVVRAETGEDGLRPATVDAVRDALAALTAAVRRRGPGDPAT